MSRLLKNGNIAALNGGQVEGTEILAHCPVEISPSDKRYESYIIMLSDEEAERAEKVLADYRASHA